MQFQPSPSRARMAVLLFSLLLAIPGAGQSRGTDVRASIRIPNFGQVNPHYYRGAQPVGHDYADLARLGVKTVIDLQEYGDVTEPQLVQSAGMKFFNIKMNTRVVPTGEQLANFLGIVNDPANQPVFVHCAGGRHRTGVMTAVYRMAQEGWTAAQAFKEMKEYHFGADFLHPEFKGFVLAYHPQLEGPAAAKVAVTTP